MVRHIESLCSNIERILTYHLHSPSSKSHIRKLENRIALLEAALEAATGNAQDKFTEIAAETPPTLMEAPNTMIPEFETSSPLQIPSLMMELPTISTSSSSDSLPGDGEDESDNIISRLCGRQWKLNSDEEGQFKYFGPTSSLHLTESVSSSLLAQGFPRSASENTPFDQMIDNETHLHLLDRYWTYQHTILQVFDREEFLEGLKTRQGKYYSKALLYTIYACAARISDRPALRDMVVPSQDDLSPNEPYLVATAAKLIDQELERPRLTSIQALLLMSVIYSSLSKDTKGWLSTGK